MPHKDRATALEYWKQYNKTRQQSQRIKNKNKRILDPSKTREMNKKWALKNPEKLKEYYRKYYQKRKYSLQEQARWKVRDAIKAGKLAKQLCKYCPSIETEAHHENYLKPLEVTWLCHKHHVAWHKVFLAETKTYTKEDTRHGQVK